MIGQILSRLLNPFRRAAIEHSKVVVDRNDPTTFGIVVGLEKETATLVVPYYLKGQLKYEKNEYLLENLTTAARGFPNGIHACLLGMSEMVALRELAAGEKDVLSHDCKKAQVLLQKVICTKAFEDRKSECQGKLEVLQRQLGLLEQLELEIDQFVIATLISSEIRQAGSELKLDLAMPRALEQQRQQVYSLLNQFQQLKRSPKVSLPTQKRSLELCDYSATNPPLERVQPVAEHSSTNPG